MTTEIKTPDAEPMQATGHELVAQAEAMKVTCHEEAQLAGAALVRVKTFMRSVQEAFAGPKKHAHEAHKGITQLEAKILALPTQAEGILKRRIGAWQAEEAKRIKDEERRLAEEARKREEEQRLAEAVQLEAEGQAELAEAVISQPVIAPVVSIAKPQIKGISTSMQRTFRIVDVTKINREFLVPDETRIRQVVQAMGKDAEKVVGGIVYEERPITRVGSR